MNESTMRQRIFGTQLSVSLVFLVLAVGLQALVWVYWSQVLEPRLMREATSQANVLAHSQAIKLADVLVTVDKSRRSQALHETVDGILLFTDPESRTPLFRGIALKADYDILNAPPGSLDLVHGDTDCPECFSADVGLYSALTDELLGIARFQVSDTLYRRLSRDVERTLFTQSLLGMLLLFLVWGVVSVLIRALNRSRRQVEVANQDLQGEIRERRIIADELRANEHQLQLITDNSPAFIAYVGIDDLKYRFVNRRFLKAYQLPKEGVVGHHIREIIGEGNYRYALPYIEMVRKGDAVSYENVFRTTEGERWIHVNYVPDFDDAGAVRGIVVMSLDITERKEVQLKLQRAKETAETASKAKSAFLANMSHELRTPLNAILGFSELMRNDRKLSASYRDYVSIINRSGEYLLELINDILELSKIEASDDKPVEETFDLYEALDKVTEMVRFRAERKNLKLETDRPSDLPRYITMDERKLRQILLNLLGNGVKFTEEGGVTLRVRAERPADAGVAGDALLLHFEVEDSGPGISDQEREKVFEAFTQGLSGYDKQEGTGLGLAITRQFVQQLGGEINVESQTGLGTVFSFSLRVRSAAVNDLPVAPVQCKVVGIKPPPGAENSKPYRLLVVDDHPENRKLLCLLLEKVGFEVRCAADGRQAVALNESWQPDLIWMDMRMPVMDGYRASELIRTARDQVDSPVIIALTASAFKENRDAVLAAGCDDFLRRPFREEEIFSMLRKHLALEFICESPDASGETAEPAGPPNQGSWHSAISRLPSAVIAELRGAIELSDMERMEKLVTDIGREQPALAAGLKKLVDTFQYDRLLQLLENADGVREGQDEPGA